MSVDFAWFGSSKKTVRRQTGRERKWGAYPCSGVGELPQNARCFESSVMETGQKLTASQSNPEQHGPVATGDFLNPGQHGPITSASRPPPLPIRTIRTTQSSA